MAVSTEAAIEELRKAYAHNNLTLYLGAGVSVGSGLPTWEKLVLAMFFSTISEERLGGWRPFSNYLFAIAEWYMANSPEPLEITARKLRKYYQKADDPDEMDFLERLYQTLYGGYLSEYGLFLEPDLIRHKNPTLNAVTALCEETAPGQKGIRAVISYNYDNLLELTLGNGHCQAIYDNREIVDDALSIYHVHGYVPMQMDVTGSSGKDIVFTEDQYHRVAGDPYYWSNLVQLEHMSSSVGLMIGLSLSDRNMRRLLDAVRNAPIRARNFALLQQPESSPPETEVLDQIHAKAKDYFNDFRRSGIKSSQSIDSGVFFPTLGVKGGSAPQLAFDREKSDEPRYRHEIRSIIGEVLRLGNEQQQYVMEQLGITPIWFERYEEIPGILGQIHSQ